MNTIITKLSEIETAALAIVSHAEEQKKYIEEEMKQERIAFDKKLELDTKKQIATIREELEENMKNHLANQKADSLATLQAYKQEYQLHHESYAQEIIKHIIEV